MEFGGTGPETIRILCVDDQPGFAKVTADVLEDHRDAFEVVVETDPDEALARVESDPVDCVVSDYDMPKTDGLALLDAVREGHPHLPFILFTGKGNEAIASEAISRGVTDYLRKGTGTDGYALLANRIENAVAESRSRRTTEATRRRLAELTEATDDVLWMFTADWEELLFVNSAYEEVYGRSVEDLRADPRDFLAGVHPEDREAVEAAMDRLSDGERSDVEYRVDESTDYSRWVWAQGRPVLDDGDVARVVGFARDVTDRRERERELERHNERLDEFASAVSHDLRTPIEVASGGLELARDDCDSEHLDRVEEAVERMATITEDALALARQGRTVVEQEPIAVGPLADQCWNMVAVGDATMTVTEEFAIRGDHDRVRQVLENLFRNCVEHGSSEIRPAARGSNGRAGSSVSVRVGPIDESGFYVADDGPGIDPADREEVFEPGHSTGDEGTGFGLAIVEEIVAAHGWAVALAESAAGGLRVEVTGVEFA